MLTPLREQNDCKFILGQGLCVSRSGAVGKNQVALSLQSFFPLLSNFAQDIP